MAYWPVHPQPQPDEIFTSWIYRAARANGQKFFSLCYLLAPEHRNIHHNYDHSVTEDIVRRFADKLRTPHERAIQTTLDSYDGYLYERPPGKANRKTSILQAGVKPKESERYPLQFCPVCLSEGEPYYRKSWRVSEITVCTSHQCQLRDRCPQCLSPVIPIRNDTGNQRMPYTGEFTACHKCHFDLKEAATLPAHHGLLRDTKWFMQILQCGYANLGRSSWVYSFSFFNIVRHLIRILVSKESSLSKARHEIDTDTLSHEERYKALCMMSGAFSQWPEGFLSFCRDHNLHYSDFTCISKESNPIPFWLDSIIRPNIYMPNINPTEDSIRSAINHMKNCKMRLNMVQLNRLMGYQDSGLIKKVYTEALKHSDS